MHSVNGYLLKRGGSSCRSQALHGHLLVSLWFWGHVNALKTKIKLPRNLKEGSKWITHGPSTEKAQKGCPDFKDLHTERGGLLVWKWHYPSVYQEHFMINHQMTIEKRDWPEHSQYGLEVPQGKVSGEGGVGSPVGRGPDIQGQALSACLQVLLLCCDFSLYSTQSVCA